MGCSCGEAWLYSLCGTQSGAGFDGSQVTPFLRVCHQLSPWEEICGARAKATCEAQTSSILSGLLSHIGGKVPTRVSGAEVLTVRPDLLVFPLSVCPPFSQHCNPCHRGTRGACASWKKEPIYRLVADRGPRYLQYTTCASTSSSFSHPA